MHHGRGIRIFKRKDNIFIAALNKRTARINLCLFLSLKINIFKLFDCLFLIIAAHNAQTGIDKLLRNIVKIFAGWNNRPGKLI